MMNLKLDPEQAKQFLSVIYGDFFSKNEAYLEIRHKTGNGRMIPKFYPNPEALIEDMAKWNPAHDYYLGMAPRSNNQGGTKDDCLALFSIWSDVDVGTAGHKNPNEYQTKAEARAAIEAFSLQSTIGVDSGGGYQCHFCLDAPAFLNNGNLAHLEDINKGLALALKGDVGVKDVARIMRLPGTFNMKIPGQPRPVKIVWCERERVYSLDQLSQFKEKNGQVNSIVQLFEEDQLPPLPPYPDNWAAYAQAGLDDELATLAATPPDSRRRNDQLNTGVFKTSTFLPHGLLSENIIKTRFTDVALTIGLDPKEIRITIRSAIEAGIKHPRRLPERKAPPAAGATEPPSDLPWDEQREVALASLSKLLGITINDITFARGQNATWEITLSDGFVIALTAAQLASQTACHNKILEAGVSINPVPKAQDGVGGWRRIVVQPFTKYARQIDIGPEQTERGEVRELLETWLLESHTPEFFGKKKVHSNCSFFSIREKNGAPGLYMRFNTLMKQAKGADHVINRGKMSLRLRGLGHEAVKIFHNGIEIRAWRLNWATIPETVKFQIIKSANADGEETE